MSGSRLERLPPVLDAPQVRVRIERALPMQPSFRIRYQIRIEPFQASIRNRISACWPSQSGQLLSKRDLPRDAPRFVSPLLRTLIMYSRHRSASPRLRAQRVRRAGCDYGCSRTCSARRFLSHVTVSITCAAYQYAQYDYCWLSARETPSPYYFLRVNGWFNAPW